MGVCENGVSFILDKTERRNCMKHEQKEELEKDTKLVVSGLEVNDYPNVLFYSDSQCMLCGKTKNLVVFKGRRICKECIELIAKTE
jgi:hypothetical protein